MVDTGKHKMSEFTLPMKADDPPNLDTPTATLAGAPPGAFLKAGASARETPATVGTKSINNSPKQTTSEFLFADFQFVLVGRSSWFKRSCSISQMFPNIAQTINFRELSLPICHRPSCSLENIRLAYPFKLQI